MGPRTWLNLGLLALVLALATIAYLQPGTQQPPEKPPLAGLKTDRIDRIRVTPRKGTPVHLERGPGSRWRLTAPRAMAADRVKVRALLDLPSVRSRETVTVPEDEAAGFGLAEPELTVEMDGHRFALGGDHPIRYQRYVRVNGTVHLVSKGALSRLGGDWTAYVHRGLLPPGSEPIRLDLPEATLEKGGDGAWVAAEAAGQPGAEAVTATVDAWRHRRAFAIETLTGEPPEGPTVTVTLAGSEDPLTFTAAFSGQELQLVRPGLGLKYRFGKDAADALFYPGKTAGAPSVERGSPGNPGKTEPR